MRRRIAVLFHERQAGTKRLNYAICRMADVWRAAGHHVEFLFGVESFVAADVMIVHVDLSVVPDPYRAFADRYPVAINARVSDVRKSTYSENLVGRDDPYDGPVFVKSDLNFGGLPERMLTGRGIRPAALAKNLLRSLPNLMRGKRPSWFADPRGYRVYGRIADVPREYFDAPDLVVEKFLPERDGALYAVRAASFLGNRVSCLRILSKDPLVKPGNKVAWSVETPHAEILEYRERFAFDYGKFDYVVRDGRPVLLDMNKTPGEDRRMHPGIAAQLRDRAEGLFSFL